MKRSNNSRIIVKTLLFLLILIIASVFNVFITLVGNLDHHTIAYDTTTSYNNYDRFHSLASSNHEKDDDDANSPLVIHSDVTLIMKDISNNRTDTLHMYYINLDSSTDRANILLQEISSLPSHLSTHIQLHRVTAVTVTEVEEMLKNDLLYFKGGVNLIHGTRPTTSNQVNTYSYQEVAVSLSHLKAIMLAYNDGNDMAMIIEDDAHISPEFVENWKSYMDIAPSDWQILQWVTSNTPANQRALHIHHDYWISWRWYFWGAVAYSIRREGMKRILEASHNSTLTSDGKYQEDRWIFSEHDEVTADSYIFHVARNTYTSTFPWITVRNTTSTMGHDDRVDYTFGRSSIFPPKLATTTGSHSLESMRRNEKIAVIVNLSLKDTETATQEIHLLKVDIDVFSSIHPSSRWYVKIVVIEDKLKSFVEGLILPFSSSSVDIRIEVDKIRFNKFGLLANILKDLRAYDFVLLKDSDIQLAGFEWNTFMDLKGNSTISGPFFETTEEWLMRSRFDRKSNDRRVNFQHSALFNTPYQKMYSSLEPISTMSLEMKLVLMKSDFAAWFFEQVLTQDFVGQDNSWGPDLMWCGAAYEYNYVEGNVNLAHCSLIPLNILHRNTKTISKDQEFKQRGYEILKQFKNNAVFSKWYNASQPLRVDKFTLKQVKNTCKNKEIDLCARDIARNAVESWTVNSTNHPRKYEAVRDNWSNHYCVGDSHHSSCCNLKQCDLVRKSTLLSTCCNNTVNLENDELSLEYPLLITATPRSGTVFMTNFLNELGLQLSKDSQDPKEHGMVSWVHVFKDNEYDPFPTIQSKDLHGSKFKVIWHQLRDPLKCLTSIAFTEPLVEQEYFDYLQRHISLSDSNATFAIMDPSEDLEKILIRRALEFYLQWHTFIQALRVPMFRLEDIVEKQNMTAVHEIFRSINETIPKDDKISRLMDEDVSRNTTKTNQREHREVLNWTELCHVNIELTKQFLEMSQSFGYYQHILPDKLCV